MLSREEILKAQEIYLYEDSLYILPRIEGTVYKLYSNLSWGTRENESFWHVWDCDPSLFVPISGEKALEHIDEWELKIKEDNNRLSKAIIFATEKHNGQFRKATTIPYIVHPLEVLQILHSMNADTNLMIAGVLHDTIEDTDTTSDEIRELFGDDVVALVASHSEDKSKTWLERKIHTIKELAVASNRVKMLVLADKLSNLRSIAKDYNNIGDELWKRFNAPKEKQAWYYSNIQDALVDMQSLYACKEAYWEFVALFKDVFVKFFIDVESNTLYQICEDLNECYYLKKGDPLWKSINENISNEALDKINIPPHFYKLNPIPNTAIQIARKEAENIEDYWNEEKN